MSGSQDPTEPRPQAPTEPRRGSSEARGDVSEPRREPSEARRDVSEPRLDRQGRRFELTGTGFLGLGTVVWVPGVVLVLLTTGWAYALGWVLIAVGLLPTIVAVALLLSGVVARWAAHHRPFA